jgi:non-specific serine/threonine protein kinase
LKKLNSDNVHEWVPNDNNRLLNLVKQADALSVSALEIRYSPVKKRIPMEQLLSDRDKKNDIELFVAKRLSELLEEAILAGLLFTHDAAKKPVPYKHQWQVSPHNAEAVLVVGRHEAGIRYSLEVYVGGAIVDMSGIDVLAPGVPGFFVFDSTVFRLADVSGRMLQPFKTKPILEIGEKHAATWFKTFLKKNIRPQTQIRSSGFDVVQVDMPHQVIISLKRHPFSGALLLQVVFVYGEFKILQGAAHRVDNRIVIDDDGRVEMRRFSRHAGLEQMVFDRIMELGWQPQDQLWTWPAGNALSDWWPALLQLERAGLGLDVLVQRAHPDTGVELHGQLPCIQLHQKAESDWLNISGSVEIDGYRLPFARLLPAIRERRDVYVLPDGRALVIPTEWLARFSDIAEYVAAHEADVEDVIRVPRSRTDLHVLSHDAALGEPRETANIVWQGQSVLQADLRPYQLDGVHWLLNSFERFRGVCLSDDMGLGKTLQTIAVMAHLKVLGRQQQDVSVMPNPRPETGLRPAGSAQTVPDISDMAGAQPAAGLSDARSENRASSEQRGRGKGAQKVNTLPNQLSLFDMPPPEQAFVAAPVLFDLDVPEALKVLVVVPASLVHNWAAELQRFAPSLTVLQHVGPKRLNDVSRLVRYDVVVTSYHTLREDVAWMQKTRWAMLVLDESQWIKNHQSEIAKAVRQLDADRVLALSGTPIENALTDLWSLMHVLQPHLLGGLTAFKREFMLAPTDANYSRSRSKLSGLVRPYFLRRTKREVAPELPVLTYQRREVEMSVEQRKLYDRMLSAARNAVLRLDDGTENRLSMLQTLTKLRLVAGHPALVGHAGASGKMVVVLDLWRELVEAGHKILIFSPFEKHIDLYRIAMRADGVEPAWISGKSNAAQRTAAVAAFQSDPAVHTMLMTLKAGGVGLNLTGADYVFLLDPWWNPQIEEQAIARAHRMGQQRPVCAVQFISTDTVEDKILALQAQKFDMAGTVFDEWPPMKLTELRALLSPNTDL